MKTLAISLIITIASIAGVSRADSGSAVSDAGVTVAAPDAGAAVGSAVAVDAGVPTIPDPIDHPADAYAAAKSDLSTYGVWGGAVVLLCIVAAFKKRNDSAHWVHNSYVLAGFVALPTILMALLSWHFAGMATTTMLATVLGALAVLYQNPKPAGQA